METTCPLCGTTRAPGVTRCDCGFCFTKPPQDRDTGVMMKESTAGWWIFFAISPIAAIASSKDNDNPLVWMARFLIQIVSILLVILFVVGGLLWLFR